MLIGITISHANAKTATSILLFGDSIIAGYGLSEEDALFTKLEQKLKSEGHDVLVINGGVSGDTTTSGLTRLEWTLNKHNPDIVLLALGGNDVLRGASPEIARNNLDEMLTILSIQDVGIILSEVQAPLNYGMQYKRAFDAMYSDLADEYSVPLYPFLLKNTFGKKDLMQSDQIHPNANGINLIAEELSEYFDEYLQNNY